MNERMIIIKYVLRRVEEYYVYIVVLSLSYILFHSNLFQAKYVKSSAKAFLHTQYRIRI